MAVDVFDKRTDLVKLLEQASCAAPDPILPKEAIVYGAGTFGQQTARLLEANGITVKAIVDRNPKSGLDWECLQPDAVGKLASLDVMIGICNYQVDIATVNHDLKAQNFTGRIYSPVETYQLLEASKPQDHYWLATKPRYLENREKILSIFDLLADELSKQVYCSIWRYRLTGNPTCLPRPMSAQYFPSDIPSWRHPVRLIDCGAFTGDTIEDALRRSISLEAVAAFEPDPENYRKLVAYATANIEHLKPILLPCGVYDKACQLRFDPEAAASSHVSESGSIVIQCVSIDECLPGFAPTLIKMDVEGSELQALHGARSTIETHRPGLAISAYHKPADLWEVADLINSFDLGYKIFMRAHAEHCFETVTYGVPSTLHST